jgi:tetratricopeptide (TPR) repeat protein
MLAELAIDDNAFDRARRSVQAVLALPGVSNDDATSARRLAQYMDERHDLFDAAVTLLHPYLDYMNRPPKKIDTPDERGRVARALEDLERHYQLAPSHWQAAWQLAKGRAALDGVEAAIEPWRSAWAAHPRERDIAREFSLALLRTERNQEALVVARAITEVVPGDATLWCNRGVCELLNGNLDEARRSVAKSREIDPTDPIAGVVARHVAECESGKPLPRSLGEMERG